MVAEVCGNYVKPLGQQPRHVRKILLGAALNAHPFGPTPSYTNTNRTPSYTCCAPLYTIVHPLYTIAHLSYTRHTPFYTHRTPSYTHRTPIVQHSTPVVHLRTHIVLPSYTHRTPSCTHRTTKTWVGLLLSITTRSQVTLLSGHPQSALWCAHHTDILYLVFHKPMGCGANHVVGTADPPFPSRIL